MFGLEVRETGGMIGGGGEVGGADYGYQSGTECVYRGWVPKHVYVWYGLDFGKYSDSRCQVSGRRCCLCVLGVGGLVLAVMSVLAGKRGH